MMTKKRANMWSKFRKRFTRKTSEKDYIDVVCLNCDTKFSGHFCPNCGQAVREYDKPFSFIFYNFLGDFFAFDTRFFRTLAALLFRPGFLSKEYIGGRRVRYAPPIRIFIFVSFVMFLLLQFYTNRGLTTVLDSGFENGNTKFDSISTVVVDSVMNELNANLSTEEKAVADSLLLQVGIASDTADSEDLDFGITLESFRDTRDFRKTLSKYATSMEAELETETDPEKRADLRKYIRMCRSPESAVAKILKYISYAFFLLLPIFALLLKLIYARRKQNYIRHLVFSIHVHSFIFLMMTIIVASYMIFNVHLEWLIKIMVFGIPIYIIIAMKKFYGQGLGKVIVKFLVVSFLYNICFAIVLGYATLNAINLI